MSKTIASSATPESTSAGNVLVPSGLLRCVSNKIYDYNPRRVEPYKREVTPLGRLVYERDDDEPAKAEQRALTPDYGVHGAQIGLAHPASSPARLHQNSLQSQVPWQDHGRSWRLNSNRSAKLARKASASDRNQARPSLQLLHSDNTIPENSTLEHSSNIVPNGLAAVQFRTSDNGYLTFSSRNPRRVQTPTSDRTISPTEPGPIVTRDGRFSIVRYSEEITSPGTQDIKIDSTIRKQSVLRRTSIAVGKRLASILPDSTRRSSIQTTYEKALKRQKQLQRSKPSQVIFQYMVYALLLTFIYLILVGRPLWGGTVWYIYVLFDKYLGFVGGSAIFIGLAAFYALGPLFVFFEQSARIVDVPYSPMFPPHPAIRGARQMDDEKFRPRSSDTALLIPCYKSQQLLPATLEAALKVFPATSIFVLANGNSPTPLDDTESVCVKYNVNHIWVPVGSKIVAQYVGCYVARSFRYVLLIDDDCLLPPEFPIVTERLKGRMKCLGYTIKSIGANGSRGTYCQQAQDLEYKLSGLQRQFAGMIGSATFPHGAIVLWDRRFLVETFKEHPGFSVSEDWFFGHVARVLGSRITMCSSIFVETETPSSVFFSSGGARGGFGEMTVFKQRFKRWNFFFVNGMWFNLKYILFSWRLGFWEIGAKLFVFQEVYETFLYLITPIVLPISFIVRPTYTAYLFAATFGLYLLNAVMFNEIHLRLSNQMVNRWVLLSYYMPFKAALTIVNVASCWWSLWQYAKYFSKRHPRIIEDEKAVGVVLKIEEDAAHASQSATEVQDDKRISISGRTYGPKRLTRYTPLAEKAGYDHHVDNQVTVARRMTATAVEVDVRDIRRVSDGQVIMTDVGNVLVVDEAEELTEKSGIDNISHGGDGAGSGTGTGDCIRRHHSDIEALNFIELGRMWS